MLLLEAGRPDRHPFLRMPIAHPKVRHWPAYSWNYRSEPEPALNGRSLIIPRGKTLGGSSSINGMIYVRGNARDYDLWRQRGLNGWSHADVLPYFKRLEASWRGASDHHGDSGPIKVTQVNSPYMNYDTLKQAAVAAGHAALDDPYAGAQEGVVAGRGDDRRRQSSEHRAHLPGAGPRRGPISPSSPSAMTSQHCHRPVARDWGRLSARRENLTMPWPIVKSSCPAAPMAHRSILMLSGIGPRTICARSAIDVVHDLPGVGQNLSEHPVAYTSFKAKSNDTFVKFLRSRPYNIKPFLWLAKGCSITAGETAFHQPIETGQVSMQLLT